jgi:hypothetical protein
MAFRHPTNGYVETCGAPWLFALLFGGFYFLAKGIWAHAAISLILTIPTFGWAWLIYPFFARGIVRAHYLSRGWTEVA